MPKILENAKEDILNTARDMIVIEGLKNINIREISSRCNISTGTIYNYFNSKQDILISVAWKEWYSTLNKIDSYNHSNIEAMEKLNLIFLELRNFLNIVHNIHHNELLEAIEVEKLMKIRKDKKDIHEVLCSKVSDALSDSKIYIQDSFVYSIIIKLFCSYAMSSNVNFKDLEPYIEKLLH